MIDAIWQLVAQYALNARFDFGFGLAFVMGLCLGVQVRLNRQHVAFQRELLNSISVMRSMIRHLDQENERLHALILMTGGVEGRRMLEHPPA
jgi:hypothetical protein